MPHPIDADEGDTRSRLADLEGEIHALRQEFRATATKGPAWTLWKEIVGTAIGAATVAVPVVVGVIAWGVSVMQGQLENKLNIAQVVADNHRQDKESSMQRLEILSRLDRMSVQIEDLQKAVARIR